jgi:hypothetical protein
MPKNFLENQQILKGIPDHIFGVGVVLVCLYQVRVITVFTVFRLLTDFVCLYNYEFWLSLCKIVRSSVILLLPLFTTKENTENWNLNEMTEA